MAEALAYGRERLASWRIGLLVLAVLGLAFLADAPGDGREAVWRTVLAGLLVVSFRIWDDLADRDHDRTHHPARVLNRPAAVGPVWVLLAGFGVLTAAVLGELGSVRSLVVLLAAVYQGLPRLTGNRFLRTQLVLAKYPAFIFILGISGWTGRVVACAAAAYLLVSLHEWSDSP